MSVVKTVVMYLTFLPSTKGTTKAILKGELAKYGLSKHGKRDDLIERLREFAKRRERWAGYEPNVRCTQLETNSSIAASFGRQ